MGIFNERANILFLETNIAPFSHPREQWSETRFPNLFTAQELQFAITGGKIFAILKPFAGNEMSMGTPFKVGQVHENLYWNMINFLVPCHRNPASYSSCIAGIHQVEGGGGWGCWVLGVCFCFGLAS